MKSAEISSNSRTMTTKSADMMRSRHTVPRLVTSPMYSTMLIRIVTVSYFGSF